MQNNLEYLKQQITNVIISNLDSYNEIDMFRLLTDDWTVERCCLKKFNHDEIVKLVLKCFDFKERNSIYKHHDQYFAKELWEIAPVLYGKDKAGRHIFWQHIALNPAVIENFVWLLNKFMAHLTEKYDWIAHRSGTTVVSKRMDKPIKVNRNYLVFANFYKKISDSYPKNQRFQLFVDFPFSHSYLIHVNRFFMNHGAGKIENYACINSKELVKYIDQSNILEEFFTSNVVECLPKNLRPFSELYIDYELNDKQNELFYKCIR